MSDSVQVNPPDLLTYGRNVATEGASAIGSLNAPIGTIVEQTMQGLLKPPGGTTPFAEAISAQQMIKRNLTEFQAFLGDVGRGLQAIQNAATAMAVAYAVTDDDSTLTLGAIDFAFADGKGSAPKGFPTGKGVSTMDAQAQANADASGQNTLAAAAAGDQTLLSNASSSHPVDGGTEYLFSDGSRLVITTTTSNQYLGNSMTTMSVYKDATSKKPVQVTGTGSNYDYSGHRTTIDSRQTTTADGRVINTTTSITHHDDGTTDITTTTIDDSGQPHTVTTTTKGAPTVADPSRQGEVEKVENQVNAKGDQKYVKELGT